MPSDLSLFVWRYHRGVITREEELHEGVETFLSDLEEKLAKLQSLRTTEQPSQVDLEDAIAEAS